MAVTVLVGRVKQTDSCLVLP